MAINETEGFSTEFLQDYAGAGFEGMGASAFSIPYLGLIQPDSEFESAETPAGTWRNSVTGKNYGDTVKVVILAFRTIWSEREADPPYRTVGRYAVGSIHVDFRYPPKGKRGYPKMFNPNSGNEIQELFVYAVTLVDYPEDGVLYFSPTAGNMRVCKSWNLQANTKVIPNTGAKAPIFGYTWNLHAGLAANLSQPNKKIAKLLSVSSDSLISRELFTTYIQPKLIATTQAVALLTSEEDEE